MFKVVSLHNNHFDRYNTKMLEREMLNVTKIAYSMYECSIWWRCLIWRYGPWAPRRISDTLGGYKSPENTRTSSISYLEVLLQ